MAKEHKHSYKDRPLASKSVLGVTRPNFLLLTPICVSIGVATAALSGHTINWSTLAVVLLGAVMAHISANALNEYADFHSGLDFKTTRTPFSGGSGTLVGIPEMAPQALLIGIVSSTITLISGLYLVWQSGTGLIPLGLLGLIIIFAYSGPINRNRYLVLIAPGLGFGPLMVVGTHYALTGEYSESAVLASLIPFFLVNNLLFLNQVPDKEPDQNVGRDNFVIALKTKDAAMIYGGFAFAAYFGVVIGTALDTLPLTAMICLLTAPFTFQVFSAFRKHQGTVEPLLPALGMNVAISLSTPLLLTVGIGLNLVV